MPRRRKSKPQARYVEKRNAQRQAVQAVISNLQTLDREEPESEKLRNGEPFLSIKCEAGKAQIVIYDEVSFWGVNAEDVMNSLRDIDAEEIELRINSPGGNVYDGIAIYQQLKSHKATITTHVDGIAASIVSVIAQAGDEIIMHTGSRMMIHNARMFAFGTGEEMRATADLLDAVTEDIKDIYLESMDDGDRKKIGEMMDAETYMSAEETVQNGFADRTDKKEKEESKNSGDAIAAASRLRSLLKNQQLLEMSQNIA